jgi:hypothetical protein
MGKKGSTKNTDGEILEGSFQFHLLSPAELAFFQLVM